ncbi:MAG TPA: hypothetical protein VLE24_01725, partial [Methyloceanibacter sp.]|nr:hypothetical protein [Methyloceanibacter sp.]
QFAASLVLRTFEDYLVAALPSESQLAALDQLYPDIRVEIHATAGRKLSDELQDGTSFRYGIVSLGGRAREDVLQSLEACRAGLGIVLLPVGGDGVSVTAAPAAADSATNAELSLNVSGV